MHQGGVDLEQNGMIVDASADMAKGVVPCLQESGTVRRKIPTRRKPRGSPRSSFLHQCWNGGWLSPTNSPCCKAASEVGLPSYWAGWQTLNCVSKDIYSIPCGDAPVREWWRTSNRQKSNHRSKDESEHVESKLAFTWGCEPSYFP